MIRTLAITAPIYLVVALGYLAVRLAWFEKSDMRVLGAYVMRFALPALVFAALAQRPIGQIAEGRYLLDYALGSLLLMGISIAWGRGRQGKDLPSAALAGLGMASSNSGFIGFPVASQVIGPGPAAVALAMCMVVENLVMIPVALALAESGGSGAVSRWHVVAQSFAQLLRNPLILAIVAGGAVSVAGVPLPDVLARGVGLLAASSTAVALFVIGGALVGLQVRGMRRDVGVIALAKLLVHPTLVGLFAWLLPPPDPALRVALVVYASSPMLSIYPLLAQKYGLEGRSAAALLLATVLSFMTISLILWVLGPLLGELH